MYPENSRTDFWAMKFIGLLKRYKMKIRNCFVSNSSSSSFIINGKTEEEIRNQVFQCFVNAYIKKLNSLSKNEINELFTVKPILENEWLTEIYDNKISNEDIFVVTFPEDYEWDNGNYPEYLDEEMTLISNYPKFRD